ncbi:MAG: hypothetical protein ACK559_23515, partial [bacterium]
RMGGQAGRGLAVRGGWMAPSRRVSPRGRGPDPRTVRKAACAGERPVRDRARAAGKASSPGRG